MEETMKLQSMAQTIQIGDLISMPVLPRMSRWQRLLVALRLRPEPEWVTGEYRVVSLQAGEVGAIQCNGF